MGRSAQGKEIMHYANAYLKIKIFNTNREYLSVVSEVSLWIAANLLLPKTENSFQSPLYFMLTGSGQPNIVSVRFRPKLIRFSVFRQSAVSVIRPKKHYLAERASFGQK